MTKMAISNKRKEGGTGIMDEKTKVLYQMAEAIKKELEECQEYLETDDLSDEWKEKIWDMYKMIIE